MTALHLLPALAVLLAVLSLLLWRLSVRDARLEARLRGVGAEAGPGVAPGRRHRLSGGLARLGATLTETDALSARTVAELRQTLAAAGFRGPRALGAFVGGKLVGVAGLPLLLFLLLSASGAEGMVLALAVPGAAIAGLLLPDLVLRRLRRRYLRDVERGLPDALDLLVICAESGLALEASVERVAGEMRAANPAVAAELALCAGELRLLADRRAALLNMAARTGLETLRRVASTLAQSLKLGTPLVQALRTLSAEMRHEQLVRFEARAARLPVLLTVPMIVFILPTLVIIAAGPAIIEVMRLW